MLRGLDPASLWSLAETARVFACGKSRKIDTLIRVIAILVDRLISVNILIRIASAIFTKLADKLRQFTRIVLTRILTHRFCERIFHRVSYGPTKTGNVWLEGDWIDRRQANKCSTCYGEHKRCACLYIELYFIIFFIYRIYIFLTYNWFLPCWRKLIVEKFKHNF